MHNEHLEKNFLLTGRTLLEHVSAVNFAAGIRSQISPVDSKSGHCSLFFSLERLSTGQPG